MNRQYRRRIEREWNKIKVGAVCTNFIERNKLFRVRHIISYQAVKVSEEMVCVYNTGLFDFKKDRGHGEYVTMCMFIGGSLIDLGSMRIRFVHEIDLWEIEEID